MPTLTPHLSEGRDATGTGVVVAPGGAMHFLPIDDEGSRVAERPVEHGIAAFVLHYRVAATPVAEHEWAIIGRRSHTDFGYLEGVGAAARSQVVADGLSAVRILRERESDFGIRTDRIGMIGFSAGGFVTVATALDGPAADRPDFAAGVYPALWGEAAPSAPTPPMFLAWASDDEGGDLIIGSALRIYEAWRRVGGSVEAHTYATGGYGFGVTARGTASEDWFEHFHSWLTRLGY